MLAKHPPPESPGTSVPLRERSLDLGFVWVLRGVDLEVALDLCPQLLTVLPTPPKSDSLGCHLQDRLSSTYRSYNLGTQRPGIAGEGRSPEIVPACSLIQKFLTAVNLV